MELLIHVEDPGAANMLAGVPAALTSKGVSHLIIAEGFACARLADMGIPYAPPDGDAFGLIERIRPSAVVAGAAEAPRSLGLKLIESARSRGLPTAGLVDGPSNPDHRFRGTGRDPLGYAPDRLLVPDEATATLFFDLGVRKDAISVTGHPHFDAVHDARAGLEAEGQSAVRARVFPNLAPTRRLLLFAAEISDGHDTAQFRRGDAYTLAGRGGGDARTDIVLEEVLDAVAGIEPRPFVGIRLHPKNTTDEFASYAEEIDAFSTGGLPLEALFAADWVVGMTSMVMWEAALLGRPTLAVIPRQVEKSWLSAIGLGVVPAATTTAEIQAMLLDLVSGDLRGRDAADVVSFGAARRIADALAGYASWID